MIPFYGHNHHIPSSSRALSSNAPPPNGATNSQPQSRSTSRTSGMNNSRRPSPAPGGPQHLAPAKGTHTPNGAHTPQLQHMQGAPSSHNGTPIQHHAHLHPSQQPQHNGHPQQHERTYAQALIALDSLPSNASVVASLSTHSSTGGDPNLKAMPEMLDWLARAGYTPQDLARLRCIHVAGTKGKGSVCAMVDGILNAYRSDQRQRGETEGLAPEEKVLGRVSMYTSPHLVTVRERIRLDGRPISKEAFTRYFFQLWDAFTSAALKDGIPPREAQSAATKPGYFRYLTIMAWHVFLQEGVESAIIEAGIGGEYDSTNLLPSEAVSVSVITALGIDHVPMLGDSLSSIAWHKSGVMKKNTTCLTIPQPIDAMAVLRRRREEKGAQLLVVNRRAQICTGEFPLKLSGDFQRDNASLAVTAAGIHLKNLGLDDVLKYSHLPDLMKAGLSTTEWPGRCMVNAEGNIRWCIDGAHTPDSISAASTWFSELWKSSGKRPSMLIFSSPLRDAPSLGSHLNREIVRNCGPDKPFQVAAFVGPSTWNHQAQSQTSKQDGKREKETCDVWLGEGGSQSANPVPSIEQAIENAREIALARFPETFYVFIVGSLKLVGGVLEVLGGREEGDEWERERERHWQAEQQRRIDVQAQQGGEGR